MSAVECQFRSVNHLATPSIEKVNRQSRTKPSFPYRRLFDRSLFFNSDDNSAFLTSKKDWAFDLKLDLMQCRNNEEILDVLLNCL